MKQQQVLMHAFLKGLINQMNFKPIAYFFITEEINIPALKYTDKVPQGATYFYRLKLTGKDGSADSSKLVMIKIGSDQKTH